MSQAAGVTRQTKKRERKTTIFNEKKFCSPAQNSLRKNRLRDRVSLQFGGNLLRELASVELVDRLAVARRIDDAVDELRI